MQVPYLKMHGTGNLILIVDQQLQSREPPSVEELRELGNQETGPGFDQLMWIESASNESSLASYRVFNNDGSEVEQCGNGVRCVARYLADRDGTEPVPDKPVEFELQSPAGPVAARVYAGGQVAVSMGAPAFAPEEIPFYADSAANTYELAVGEESIEIAALSMGNPHAVIDVEDVLTAPVEELGPRIENHERFPERTNVGFMHIRNRADIELRVYERGAGETAACGTGACAAVVSGQRRNLLDNDVTVHLPGGEVVVSWRGGDAPVWLMGNAELITEGTIDIQE